jgi:lipid-binding SYLF domain-containing protein
MKFTALIPLLIASALSLSSCSGHGGLNSPPAEVEKQAHDALANLYSTTPGAASLGSRATAILVFPNVINGGFVFGAQYGDGVLYEGGRVTAFYNTAAASFGFQAGLQKFGYALFFMSPEDLAYLHKSEGWELSALPSLTVVDQGLAANLSTSTARKGVYAFFFEQRGLMGGVSVQGAKVTRINAQ